LPKIEELVKQGKLDNYLVFTNRKLTSQQDMSIKDTITSYLSGKKLPKINCQVFGSEKIQLWLKSFPEITKTLNLNKLLIPLNFYEDDIRQTIITFASSDSKYDNEKIQSIQERYLKLPIEEKNNFNNLSADYFREVLRNSYTYFGKISIFLQDPVNSEYKEKYFNTINDIQEKITIKRSDYGCFDDILSYLYDKILDETNTQLLAHRRYIRIFLHFMYAECDIGKKAGNNAIA
jgi:hypothetical protein